MAPVLAGMTPADEPVRGRDPGLTDTDQVLADAGFDPARIAELRERGIVA